MESGAVAYVRQLERLGLGHAVWCARRLIADEPFAVILPDDVIDAQKPCLQQMVEAYAEVGGNMVAAMEVPAATVSSYGILDVAPRYGPDRRRCAAWSKSPRRSGRLEPRGDRPLYPVAPGAAPPQRHQGGRRRRDPADRRDRQGDRRQRQRLRLPLQGPPLRLRLQGRISAGDRGLRLRARGSARRVPRFPAGRRRRGKAGGGGQGVSRAARRPARCARSKAAAARPTPSFCCDRHVAATGKPPPIIPACRAAHQAACSALPSVRMA